MVIEDAESGMRLRGLHKYLGLKTNNEAEYHALIEGLQAIKEWRPDAVEVYLDSKLVVEQLNGRYRVKAPELMPLHRRAQELIAELPVRKVEHVERAKNRGADYLANKAIDEKFPKKKKLGG